MTISRCQISKVDWSGGHWDTIYIRERPLMMSDFRGDGGSEMTPKNRTLEGKNRTLGGMGGQKLSKIVGHHLWMIPHSVFKNQNCMLFK